MNNTYIRTYVLLVIVALTSVGRFCHADTFYVSDASGDDAKDGLTWGTAKKTVGAACEAAQDGDTVLVTNGVYVLTDQIHVTKALTIRSVAGASVTTVDANRTARCFRLNCTNGPIVISGFTITGGDSSTGGGVVFMDGVQATLRECIVTNNVANEGGGIGVKDETQAVVEDCVIAGNTARWNGGGVYLFGSGLIRNCTILNNSAMQGDDESSAPPWGGGGACIAWGGTLRNCLIAGNSVSTNGGGVSLYGNIGWGGIIESCTIVSNSTSDPVSGDGGGVFVDTYGEVRNTIISGNVSAGGANWSVRGTNTRFEYCCSTPSLPNGTGNVAGDPLFAASPVGRLHAASPCIDAGTNATWMLTSADIDGQPRLFNGRVDIGADETCIRCVGISVTGTVLTAWETIPGAECQLEWSTNLWATNWYPLGTAVTTPGMASEFSDADGAARQKAFYRLKWFRE